MLENQKKQKRYDDKTAVKNEYLFNQEKDKVWVQDTLQKIWNK